MSHDLCGIFFALNVEIDFHLIELLTSIRNGTRCQLCIYFLLLFIYLVIQFINKLKLRLINYFCVQFTNYYRNKKLGGGIMLTHTDIHLNYFDILVKNLYIHRV